MFQDQPTKPGAQSPSTPAPPSTAAADSPPVRPPPAARASAPAPRPRPPHSPARLLHGRLVAPALATATLITATLAAGQILTATTAPAPTMDVTQAGPTAVPVPGPSIAASPQAVAAQAPPTPIPAAAAPQPVVIGFGTRSEVGDGWQLAASRPYLCDVLMAIPVLQQDGTRIMRVTLTLTNRTGTPQPTRTWQLAASADGTLAELVLWPAERFRGVPDMTLTPGRSVRFLVAIRVPEHPVRLRITAERDAAPRAVLDGSL